ncbi:MAG: hypothetical protein ACRCZ9_03150 [Fusobacteriaceae bacterium]
MKTDKNTIYLALIAVFLIIYLIRKGEKTIGSIATGLGVGDSEQSKQQRNVDTESVKKQIDTKFWLNKEKSLPAKQKTTITNATSKSMAVALWERLRPENFQTMTNANAIYDILSRIGTEGSLYFVIHHYGVRNGMDLPTSLRYILGFDNKFSKDLDEVNALYKKRGFNYLF